MQKIRAFIGKFISKGIPTDLPLKVQQHFRDIQTLGFTFLIGIVFFLITFASLGQIELLLLNLIILVMNLGILYLGWQGRHRLSGLAVIILLNLATILNQSFLGPAVSLKLVFIILIILPVLVLEPWRRTAILLLQLLALLFFLALSLDLLPYAFSISVLPQNSIFINRLFDWVILGGVACMGLLLLLNRRQNQRLLDEAQQKLNRFQNSKSRFLSAMRHEIRTPIHSLLGVSDLLANTALSPEQEEYHHIIRTSSETLLSLVNGIVDYSQVEFGLLELDKRPFVISDILDGVTQSVIARIQKRGLEFQVITARKHEETLLGDSERLRQILMNLVDHAIRYTFAGGISIRVSDLGQKAGLQELLFEISHTGTGIAEAELNRLLTPDHRFEQDLADPSSYSLLGLAVAAEIIRKMGGELKIEHSPKEGSHLSFALGFVLTRKVSGPRSLPITPPGAPPQGPPILLVEDNKVNQKVISRILEKGGYDVQTVGDGQAAVEACHTQDFALVLMDLGLPVLSGLEASRLILSQPKGPRPCPVIIALTAYSGTEDRQKCLAIGMKDFLTKPVRSAELMSLVQRWLPAE
jgi:signal transduction histidine kinase/CheY-like chemotaxis protein